jgi:integrase
VLTDALGGYIRPQTMSYEWRRLMEQLDVPTIRLHDLRHTHATLALKAGVHPKVVSERLGHATVGITLDLYSHVAPSLAKDAAEQIMSATYGADESGFV